MDCLHERPEIACALGTGARQRFDRLFTGRLMGDRYADIYRSLLNSGSRTAPNAGAASPADAVEPPSVPGSTA